MAFDPRRSLALAQNWRDITGATATLQMTWAQSRRSEPALLELLCSVDDLEVARTAIANPNLDTHVLGRLAGHSRAEVRLGVAYHRQTSSETLVQLSQDSEHAIAVAAIERLVVSDQPSHRLIAASSPITSRYALLSLLNDTELEISEAAKQNLERLTELELAAIQESLEAEFTTYEPHARPVTKAAPVVDQGIDQLPESQPEPETASDSTKTGWQPESDTHSRNDTDAPVGVDFDWDNSEFAPSDNLFDLLADDEETQAELSMSAGGENNAVRNRAEILADGLMNQVNWTEGRDALIRAFSRKNFGALRATILREIERGMCPEELLLALELREYWQESWADSGNGMLTWSQTLTLIRSFDGYPDLVEVTGFLELAFRQFKLSHRHRIGFDRYLWELLDTNAVRNYGSFYSIRYHLERNGF